MRVCFVSHSAERNGAERALLELIDAQRPLGVEPLVLLPGKGPLVEELGRRRIAFSILPYRQWIAASSPLWKRTARTALNVLVSLAIAIKIRRARCDLVYTNTIAVGAGALAARLAGRPHLWHLHEMVEYLERSGLTFDLGTKLSLRLVDKLSSLVVCNSEAVRKRYAPHLRAPVKVIYQSVTIPPASPSPHSEGAGRPNGVLRFVMVGSVQREKGQEEALHALLELRKTGLEAKLSIIGSAEEEFRNVLETVIREAQLGGQVELLGYLEDPVASIREAHALLTCSAHEAFGRASVEAMLAGKPVIGPRSGGALELVQDGETGLLYTPGDPKDLAEKIRRLHDHPGLARRMGERGREWASERFSQARYGREMLEEMSRLSRGGQRKLHLPA